MKKFFSLVVSLISVCMISSTTFANYYIDFWYIQHGTYENGNEYNRLAFAVRDQQGAIPDSTDPFVMNDVVTVINLFYPDASQVSFEPPPSGTHFGGSYKTLNGRYEANRGDSKEGQWIFSDTFTNESWYRADFLGILRQGLYQVHVEFTEGTQVKTFDADVMVNGQKNLPIVSANSFRGYHDSSGNLILIWTPPHEVGFWLTSEMSTSARGILEAYVDGIYAADLYIRQPTHLGVLIVPSNVFQNVQQKLGPGNITYKTLQQLRTNDNNNRTYSNAADISSLPPPGGSNCQVDFDIDGDVDGSDLATFAADFGRVDCLE